VTLAGANAGGAKLALRLPELIGVWLMMICMHRFIARQTSPQWGTVAAMFLLVSTPARVRFEARPYGMVLGLRRHGRHVLAELCYATRRGPRP